MTTSIRPLTQEQRHAARRAACEAVIYAIGTKPMREQFTYVAISKYPPAIVRLISGLCLVLLLAAFTPSAIRLYVIGSQTFGQAVPSHAAKTAVGLATVLSAEIGQVVFSLALATLGTSRASKRLLYLSMMLSTIISLVGNVQLALPGYAYSPFAWLEAVVPPLLVLATSFILKEQLLGAIETRHINERVFQTALADWQVATATPEHHSEWAQCHANALRDELRKVNYRRQEALAALTTADWRMLVYRELQAEQWYVEPGDSREPAPEREDETALVPLRSLTRRNGNSAHSE
jgi:hypothetical protein